MASEIVALIWLAGLLGLFMLTPVGFWRTVKVFNRVKADARSNLQLKTNAPWSDTANQWTFWKYILRKQYVNLPDAKLRKQCMSIRRLFLLQGIFLMTVIGSQAYIMFTGH